MSETLDEIFEKTKEETDRKCPHCGGVLSYSPNTQNLVCEHCAYSEEIINPQPHVNERNFFSADFTKNHDWGVKTKKIICQSCGGESIFDALDVAGVCPYCDTNQVMEAYDDTSLAPHGVCPFSVDEEQSMQMFKTWISGKAFCPGPVKKRIKPEKLHGVYLPYWTFDTYTSSSYRGEYGMRRYRRDSDGKSKEYMEWHLTSGTYRESIDDHLVIGTNRFNDKELKGLGEFATENSLGYKPEYLAGFAAERYSIGVEDAWESAKTQITKYLGPVVTDHIRFSNHANDSRLISMSVSFDDIGYKYLMLPVWMSSFKYKNVVYHFYINGQTGKVCGKTPVSSRKVILLILSIIVFIILIFMAIEQNK